MKLNIKALETYVAAHVAPLEDAVKAEFTKFVDYVRGEEAKIEAEVQHLTGRGYTVTPPAEAAPPAAVSVSVTGSVDPAVVTTALGSTAPSV